MIGWTRTGLSRLRMGCCFDPVGVKAKDLQGLQVEVRPVKAATAGLQPGLRYCRAGDKESQGRQGRAHRNRKSPGKAKDPRAANQRSPGSG